MSVTEKMVAAQDEAARETAGAAATTEHFRGSSLLLVGRVVAYALEFIAQILLVRYLTKSDFGAFSYALSIVVVLKSLAIMELPNALSRFVPIYRERKQYGALLGTIALSVGAVAVVAGLLAAGVFLAVGPLGLGPTEDARAMLLLVALALLIPLEGLDALLTALFAALAGARPIAFRQVLSPALKLALVLALIVAGADVLYLAVGYVAVATVVLVVYVILLFKVLGGQPWLRNWQQRGLSFPVRQVFGFALPMLTSTAVWALMDSADAVLLGLFQNSEAVASYRAVSPLPKVLVTMTMTFSVLYAPLASQLYTTNQRQELANLYRRLAMWMTVLLYPLFGLTVAFAYSTTTGLYGERYASSAPIMALLGIGSYLFALTGLNGLTLKICGKLRFTVLVDIGVAVLNLAANLILIPRFGAVGAAVGTGGAMVLHNALKQYGVQRYLGINLLERRSWGLYATVGVTTAALLALQLALPATLWLAVPLTAVGSLVVLWAARGALGLGTIFPELQRFPLLAKVLAPWLQ